MAERYAICTHMTSIEEKHSIAAVFQASPIGMVERYRKETGTPIIFSASMIPKKEGRIISVFF